MIRQLKVNDVVVTVKYSKMFNRKIKDIYKIRTWNGKYFGDIEGVNNTTPKFNTLSELTDLFNDNIGTNSEYDMYIESDQQKNTIDTLRLFKDIIIQNMYLNYIEKDIELHKFINNEYVNFIKNMR